MVFSSPIFLFGFLPVILLVYYLSPRAIKNITLLIASLMFYAWGEVFYVGIMITSIIANYTIGRLIYSASEDDTAKEPGTRSSATIFVSIGIAINVGLLISFKYANFITDNFNNLTSLFDISAIELAPVHLPLGISFFTFQAISYIVDVYRREVSAQKNIYNLALYISLFPQLIAGPIVRYHDVAAQITDRTHSLELVASGVQRFIFGLAKKMLIANPLGEVADNIFALSSNELTMQLAWLGIIAYSLQIFFDFSGYSDMAIGLGRMFGFRFLENFNYPYISRSLREFWRRWHISLSTWFKDYVYISLGGNRVSTLNVYRNLLIVFFLTGAWHGASWNFIVWGLFHGAFMAAEHAGFSKILDRTWKPVQHLYLLFIVCISWVFFRADTLTDAIAYLKTMFDINLMHTTELQYAQVTSNESVYALFAGLLFSIPVYMQIKNLLTKISDNNTALFATAYYIPKFTILTALLSLSILKIAASTYNPFIYFRF